ncbi:hypothetical protein GOV12_00540 [Candidatus Pacearchaeota archaeon]|nr:hypothetical protein [Candidatus Pacearchaeota archaeon]
MGLVDILKNTGRGAVTGLADIIDPVGEFLSDVDYVISGVGPSEKDRAIPTFNNLIYQEVYKKPDEDVKIGSGYIPRGLGYIAGTGAGGFGLYSLYAAFGLSTALALPAALGLYSMGSFLFKYLGELTDGERVGEDKYEKAKISDGFKNGYEQFTHLSLMSLLHSTESDLTGRGLNNSHLKSSMVPAAKPMRRNIGAVLGYLGGNVVGLGASVLTLGILPIYKTCRDICKSVKE